jgi:protein-S-isoprenylcysteine O-methyltransferase Ste14
MSDATQEPGAPSGSDAKASSPFIWPPVIYATAAVASGFLAWFAPLPFVPEGYTGWLIRFVGVLLIALGGAVALSAEKGFKRAGTPVPPTKPTTALVTEGIYARTRNPMYLGLTLVLSGLGLALGSVWFLLATPVAMFAVTKLAIEREERYLAEKFGQDYLGYRARVRRWV